MKIRSQVGMVLNLDKCIGCHTCSVTCKNVWSSREGMEYAWFNNVETKPGIGYPKNWEDQDQWQGGWIRGISGKLTPRLGNRVSVLSKIFANPVLPAIDDFAPQLLLISAGFDGHRRDPLAELQLDAADFGWLSEALVALADRHCQGRVVSALEGGYDLDALAECSVAHLRALGA